MRSPWFAALLLAGSLASCRLLIDADEDKLGPPPVACDPGEPHQCLCPNGARSVQVCNAGGAYDPCECPPPGTAGGGP